MKSIKNKVKVSIIVPIYNGEKHIKKCVESIQRQTLKDIQIILVNDGSKDNSLYLCLEFAKSDKRIVVINQPNQGVSFARNAGIAEAEGEYVGFVDPDDWINSDMYEKMYNKSVEFETQIGICNYVKQFVAHSEPVSFGIKKDLLEKPEIINILIAEMIDSTMLNYHNPAFIGTVWRLIIKKELIDNYKLEFMNDLPLMEDLLFTVNALLKVEKITINSQHLYHYYINPSSAGTKYRSNYSSISQKVFKNLEFLLEQHGVKKELQEHLEWRYINMKNKSLRNSLKRESGNNFIENIRSIKNTIEDKKFQALIKKTDYKKMSTRQRVLIYLLKTESAFLLFVYYTFSAKVREKSELLKS